MLQIRIPHKKTASRDMILSFARTRVWVSRKRFGMNFDLVNFVFGKCEMIGQERDTYFSKETSETLLRKCEETLYAGPHPVD